MSFGSAAIFLALSFSMSFFGCVSCIKKSNSDAYHTTGKVPLRTEHFLWQKLTIDEFKRDILPRMFVSAKDSDLVPESDPKSKLIQGAINRAHDYIVKKYPTLSHLPRPQAALFTDPLPNAFVETVRNCFEKPVLLGGSSDKAEFEDAVRITRNGSIADTENCRMAEPALMKEVFQFSNSLSHGCKIDERGGSLALSGNCKMNRYFNNFNRARRFSFDRISSVIYFSTGLFESIGDENLVLFIVMHELAHYYRAHPVLPEADFITYYSVGDKNSTACPLPDSQLSRMAQGENWAELTKVMNEKRLGYYTYEQEADELALEFLSELGLPTGIGSEALMRMLKQTKKSGPSELDYEACSELRKNKWLTADKKSVYVPIGNLADPHHSLCYRAYNLDRERDAHCFK
ncbi:MAG: hypothetical protein RL189_859 [Pseudomonadota bacterium]|jgi:hypothetical protein